MPLPSVIWPRKIHAETSARIRAARVIHWIASGAALVVLCVSIIGFSFVATWAPPPNYFENLEAGSAPAQIPPTYIEPIETLLLALLIAAIGRGVRYILADE